MKKFTFLLMAALFSLTSWGGGDYALEYSTVATTAPTSGSKYVIKLNPKDGGSHWLCVSSGALHGNALVETGDEAKNFVWTFTSNGSNWQLQNLGTGKYLDIQGTNRNGTVTVADDAKDVAIVVDGGFTGLKNPSAGDFSLDCGNGGNSFCTWDGKADGNRRVFIYAITEVEPLVVNTRHLLSQANAAYDAPCNIILSADQLSSPYSDNHSGGSEGHLENLIDGDASTYWHSQWGANVSAGTHYVEIKMPENLTGDFTLTYTRRNNGSNQLTEAKIVGVNKYGATEDIQTLEFPHTNNTETLTRDFTIGSDKVYPALRFVEQNTTGQGGTVGHFFHAAELQITKKDDLARNHVTNAATALKTAIDAIPANATGVTQAQYNALLSAYNAYNTAVSNSFTFYTPDALTPSLTTTNYFNVGARAEAITPATGATDNSHWYLLANDKHITDATHNTTVHDTFSPIYDNGTDFIFRGGDDALLPSFQGRQVSGNEKFLVRFFSEDGLYRIQFATGKFATSGLKTGTAAEAGYFTFQTIADNAGHFCWNKYPTTGGADGAGDRVDNNGRAAKISYWNSGQLDASGLNGNSDWAVFPVTFDDTQVSYTLQKDYGTIILPFAWTVPTDWTVYSCAGREGNTLTLTEVSAPEANKPYVIGGTNHEAQTFQGTAVTTTDELTEGWLTGVYASTSAPLNAFVLQEQEGVLGFYQVQTADIATVGANRAYLSVPEDAGVKALFFGTATGIEEMQNSECKIQNAVVYDLQGRRVSKPQHGLYIINGKKVIR